ncbi:IQ calmodulin-binding motif protein [Teratosphaeria destructans]|uniref:IQ calmodulin-binding motif protein n=1 Tax=Teratosphaeria destructans TaxID=418781 RepID=A0A9W7SL57_9PEZI|nr:IQ calmodulin-binding motif protein [Teratosphaeria destructans]
MAELAEHGDSNKVLKLCTSPESISSYYARHPDKTPGEIGEHLYNSHHLKSPSTKAPKHRKIASSREDREWARKCGNFENTQPSELFLNAYHDLLQCLDEDPLANCCSPSLCGSIGFVPLTIIAPLNDQIRHMSNLIVRARKEVLLATNFWKHSGATTFVHDAIIELSKRVGARGGEKIVFKLMYDRGDPKQFIKNHQDVEPKKYTADAVALPGPEQIPNVDLKVVNFHMPPLGTFHSKFMVVDRQIATISSNNIMDNDNVEMMSHLEGPIVDSVWDTFLVSWNNALQPPLPWRGTTAASGAPPTYQEESFKHLFEPDGSFRLPEKPIDKDLPEHMPGEPHYDDTIAGEIDRMRSVLKARQGETHADAVARHLNKPTKLDLKATAPPNDPGLHFQPFVPVPPHEAVPIAMANRKPYADLNNHSEYVPQNECFLSLIRNAKRNIFIQTPDLNAKGLLPALVDAVKRGVEITYYVCLGYNDSGELLPGQGGTNEMAANHLFSELSGPHKDLLKVYFYVAKDQDHPIHNSFKKRSCHIKLLIVDEQVTVQGSGNQDTQSWYHSQEVNVMIDSPLVCKQWREGIERNQNTREFGRAEDDGCWYDPKTGELAKGSYGVKVGFMDRVKGIVGTVQKAQGK